MQCKKVSFYELHRERLLAFVTIFFVSLSDSFNLSVMVRRGLRKKCVL
jgi:hypothetical protein